MKFINMMKPLKALGIAVTGGVLMSGGMTAQASEMHEYLLTVTRPNQLHVIDTETDKLVRSCDVPGIFGNGGIATSPDGRVAYVLSGKWEDVYGIDITDCQLVFSAKQSSKTEQVKTIISMTVSPDGKELYTVQNPVKLHSDHFEVQTPRLAVFNTADGMDAKPVRTFPVDRRITKLGRLDSGEVILGGGDVKAIDPKTGEIRTLAKLQNWDRSPEKWVPPDAFQMHTMGEHIGEYIMPYFTIKWNGDPGDMEKAEFLWGMTRIDTKTGEVESGEVLPFEFIVFNWVTDPNNKDIVYGSFNTLSKHNVKEGKTLAVHNLEHTYYNLNMLEDGSKIYVGGTSSDISVHDPETLEKIGSIQLTGDMSTSDLRIAKLRL
ncbi:quinohemoprotein amine dehydrogenase subunit beta [Neptunomonas concharum]|uniref:Quinohemoprotein amine dehydrogenase subunit beta n=1 Tax=Neptunomonas concharum TaxID=1031538 RepID=A0A5P1R9J8_9GAMM|nr:quinohemoprotein amine dehydrogenase subunit beta [Neptunomonas concharum]QEQ96300.1 quinohemoprotein amine dehydrogenase subunit beta [Neptunomonas concharum]